MTESVRERLIGSAVELVQRHGVAGTSVADLLERSGVARRSVYLHFPGGKNELITASVEEAGNTIGAMIERLVTTQSPPESLSAFIEFWKHLLTGSDFEAGCPIAAAAYGGQEAPEAREQAHRVFAHWQDLLVPRLTAYGIDEADASAVATTTIAAIEGAVMLCLADRDTAPLDRVHSQLQRLLPPQTG
ncbi:TetR/AcrR family transcriptional regulator [Rhodococcus artemisiae]|uniref:TetR/AcrR family transcriptional regulator n=1 Tax=Rhodococcus artemisiae TaxID=714159 RepID=A0ABU7LA99_9NOCA|nr:TetR/AcrR family transcriptional regulator [Rhodococcus artemisiae]MEE2058481.1 TetR/AcrR family transcriptional regulator [Rhodococcus artemisiae]